MADSADGSIPNLRGFMRARYCVIPSRTTVDNFPILCFSIRGVVV